MISFINNVLRRRRELVIDKEKGIIFYINEDGVFIDGKYRSDLDDGDEFEGHFSKYIFFDEWKDVYNNVSEGEPERDGIFLYFCTTDHRPFTNCFNSFTYCTSPKFAAGYLHYIVLGTLADLIGFTDEWIYEELDDETRNNGITRVPICYGLIETCGKNGCDKYNIYEKVKHIFMLCNSVFYEQDIEKQKEYLTYAAEKFNEYFEFAIEEAAGLNFEFRVFYGADAAKEKLNDLIRYSPSCAETMQAFEKSVWDKKDKELIKNTIGDII